MKLTVKSEYALLALIYLARRNSEAYVSVKEIAEAQKIPVKFLEQIMFSLKRAVFVRSAKGQGGGYKLSKKANEITLAEVIRLFDGALAPTESSSKFFYGSTPVEKEAKLISVFREMRDVIAEKMEKTTIADVY
ncbi:MAG: Rrf2 family transcriptional regulator [Lentisphaerae bacterium GWF2_45_14]|nr:MAG: Rrf2 family transcriptional regulator [Lentisphaerae bacterium GWF2_45_14]